jgi:hypothetical protein
MSLGTETSSLRGRIARGKNCSQWDRQTPDTTSIVNEWVSFKKAVDWNSVACAIFRPLSDQKNERTLEPNAKVSRSDLWPVLTIVDINGPAIHVKSGGRYFLRDA